MISKDNSVSTDTPAEAMRSLSADEIQSVTGGALFSAYSSFLTNRFSLVALNPQPLPPRYSFSLTSFR
jgi:hypothetical protein